jgi:hypothetical protein
MRLSAAALLSLVAALFCLSAAGLLLSGCSVALECGSWVFSGTPQSLPGLGATFPVSSAFTFTPATCKQDCDCEIDAMIQMVTVFNNTEQTYMYPSQNYEDRASADSWSIDRLDGSGYGWFGLLNDGVTFDSFYNTPGSNGTPNTLLDQPSWGPNEDIVFSAVDAAVCFKSKTCQNRILGYYFWSWTIDSNGNAAKFAIGPAWPGFENEFQGAVAAWNSWVPTSGFQSEGAVPNEPPQPALNSAVLFPTLTDL